MELRSQFWEIMKLNREGGKFQAITCIPPTALQKRFQLFEVLVVDSLNRIDPALHWTVTQVSKDGGVDFRGAGPRREFSILNLTIHQTLLGQTKRRAAKDVELFEKDLRKIGKLALSENISGVIFVFSSESLSANDLYQYFRDPDNSIHFRGAKYFVDARRFEDFWARDRGHILSVLDRCLVDEQKHIIDDYLESITQTSQIELKVHVDRDASGQTGKRFRCRLSLAQRAPLPSLSVRLRYRPDPSEASKLEVLIPSRLAGPGQELQLLGDGVTEFTFFLRCFIAGTHRLGTVQIETETGVLINSLDLGTCDFIRTFEPPYFEKPNRSSHRLASLRLQASQNGDINALAVLGSGGAGKSRFCEAVLEEAADLGFDWRSIAHINSTQARRRLIRELIVTLLPVAAGSSHIEQVLRWVEGRVHPFEQSRARALETYFTDNSKAVAIDVVTATLLTLIIERINYRPLLIHLRDLHWADSETLSILGNTIDALRDACQISSSGAIFLLEGRDHDSLRLQTGLFRPPYDWLTFLDSRGYEQVGVLPWTAAHSADFVSNLIEGSRNPADGAVAQRLPLFEELRNHILSAASGNPMHVIEQLKSLIDKEYVEVTDSGTVYLKRHLPADWQPAQTIEDLIQLRLSFLEARAPLAAELLKVMAKIGPRVPGVIFRSVCNAGTSTMSLPDFFQVDMALLPHHDGESFEFVHESYYQVCRDAEIRSDIPYLAAAIAFYQSQQSLTAKQQFEVAFLMGHREVPEYDGIVRHLRVGMDEAKQIGDDLLCLDFCKFLLNLPENVPRNFGMDSAEIKLELGIRQKFCGNWEEALVSLKDSELMFMRRPLTQESLMKRLVCKADIVNALVTLLRTDEALAEVEEGLRAIAGSMPLLDEVDVSFKRQLTEIRDWLWHRRAVCLWFDGDIVQAAKWQRRAYVSGRTEGNAITKGKALREFGALILHRNPLFGRRVLHRALEELKKVPQSHHEPSLLTEVEILVADLLIVTWLGNEITRVGEILERAMRLHFRCQEKASMYEAPLASLVAGSCCALTRELENAHQWFRLATTTAMHTRSLDEIWKGRVNLAQICLEMDLSAEARVHANEAAEAILIGLNAGSWTNRAARRAMLTWPLLQCTRIAPELESRVSRYLQTGPTSSLTNWQQRPLPISKSGQPAQVLHVRCDDSDYYLLN